MIKILINHISRLFFYVKKLIFNNNEVIIHDLKRYKINTDLANYDQSTAIYCAHLSTIAYFNEKRIHNIVESINKIEGEICCKVIEYKGLSSNTRAVLWKSNSFLIISFRGTQFLTIIDWITNFKFKRYKNKESSKEKYGNMLSGHGGFRRSLMNLMLEKKFLEEIESIIIKDNDCISSFPIILTGHSQGAGIAQLFMEPLRYKGFELAGAYNFAPPFSVSKKNEKYSRSIFGESTYDIINYKDIVARIGKRLGNIEVAHFGKYFRIHKSGLIFKEEEQYIKYKWYENILIVKNHKMKSYLKGLKMKENTFKEIMDRSIDVNVD